MKIGAFAKRTGVTVKTLLHYDKIGLLSPCQKTEVGHRIYSDDELLKLQQITTLKFVGLSLKEIKHLLNEKDSDIGNLIHIQKLALEEKKKNIDTVLGVLNKAESKKKVTEFLDIEQLIEIIKVTNMEVSVENQYKSIENLSRRSNLHSYNTNKVDWSKWCFNQMHFTNKARILELGCGTGDLWDKNSNRIDKSWTITLSDFSEGMLQNTKEKLNKVEHDFTYKVIDVQDIPYESESFDVVIARHMLYLVPDIEKALSEIKRVLVKGGKFYVTTNASEAMAELNKLMEKFDSKIGLSNNGMCERFESENGQLLLNKYFDEVRINTLSGKIIVDKAEPVVSYKASTIKGSSVLVGKKKQEFNRYIENYIQENGEISITTKACIFQAKKKV